MNEYTETQKAQDFQFFKDINEDFFAKNGHTFLAIRDTRIIDTATSVPALIEKKMQAQSFDAGTYLIQECTGDKSAYTTTIMSINMSRIMEELIEEEKIEAAEKLIAKDKMTLEDIAECLSLSLEKVRELAARLQPQMA